MPAIRRRTGIRRKRTVGRRPAAKTASKRNKAARSGRKPWLFRTGAKHEQTRRARSEKRSRCKHREKHRGRRRKRSDRIDGLLRQQRHFILEKLVGQSDRDAALAAGYTEPMASNTKQKIWARPGVREEYDRLKGAIIEVFTQLARQRTSASPNAGASKEIGLDSTSSHDELQLEASGLRRQG
jgi:hypothetical protein